MGKINERRKMKIMVVRAMHYCYNYTLSLA